MEQGLLSMAVEQYDIEWLQEQIYQLKDTIRELQDQVENLEQEKLLTVPAVPKLSNSTQCPTCGMVWKDVMGYVCPNTGCPMQMTVTC